MGMSVFWHIASSTGVGNGAPEIIRTPFRGNACGFLPPATIRSPKPRCETRFAAAGRAGSIESMAARRLPTFDLPGRRAG